ncbi:MAG: acyl-CoA dehydrogenase domain-containing protein, partial [Alphaproteobacteria bacterium]
HPHLLNEMNAAALEDPKKSLEAFDKELWAHIGGATSNVIRALWHNLTFSIFCSTPQVRGIGGMYRQLHAACVTFAVVSDLVMATLGG